METLSGYAFENEVLREDLLMRKITLNKTDICIWASVLVMAHEVLRYFTSSKVNLDVEESIVGVQVRRPNSIVTNL